MSDQIAAGEELPMLRLFTTVRQDVAFFFTSLRLRFTPRLRLHAVLLQTEGSAGQDVVAFQERFNLIARRFDISIIVNGVYDEETRTNVRQFQRNVMFVLDADGYVGPETARVLHIKLLGDEGK